MEPGDDARRKAAWEEEGSRVEPGDDARRKAAWEEEGTPPQVGGTPTRLRERRDPVRQSN